MRRNTISPLPPIFSDLRLFVIACFDRGTILRSAKTALIVGTVLALLNHWQQMLSAQFSPSWVVPTLLTYLVPFLVATYSQVQGKRQRERSRQPLSITPLRSIENSDAIFASPADVETMPLKSVSLSTDTRSPSSRMRSKQYPFLIALPTIAEYTHHDTSNSLGVRKKRTS